MRGTMKRVFCEYLGEYATKDMKVGTFHTKQGQFELTVRKINQASKRKWELPGVRAFLDDIEQLNTKEDQITPRRGQQND